MKWHHSLYWRIAVGLVGSLALLLIAQGTLFVWVLSSSGSTIPNQPPDRLAQAIAVEITQALERDPALDIDQYVHQEYGRDAQPFLIALADGRVVQIGGAFSSALIQDAQARLERFGRGDRPFGRGAFEPGDRPFGRAGPGGSFRALRPMPIMLNGRAVGLVVVPGRPPFTFLLSRYAPALVLTAVATLFVGAMLAAIVVFGPARKRLLAVEQAARRLGAGDLSARAPAGGRDEVAAVATAFNAMTNDLSALAEALAASDRARRQLLADVSHELTTPITAMRGYLETVAMPELKLDEATRARYLAVVSDETARLERIVGDLLDLARLEGGGGSLLIEDVPVAELFSRVAERHERALAEAHVAMAIAIEPGAESVKGDRARLEQALQNLAANAMRHAPAGSTITLGARPVGHGLAITVADAGSGIAPEHVPHVFDRFYKAEASRAIRPGPGGEGSGLGLSIVKAIVERHGGAVSVRSEPGRTVFELRL